MGSSTAQQQPHSLLRAVQSGSLSATRSREISMYKAFPRGTWFMVLASALVAPACDEAKWESPAESGLLGEVSQASSGSCHWQGATVDEGEWLECGHCVWRYCQCQHDGGWGHCTNHEPSGGACDWSHPDWSDPACSEGGSKPCDWSNPDWQNPDCNDNSPPGGGPKCTSCHPNGPPEGTPPPHVHTWL
jgi:hypothetical protein